MVILKLNIRSVLTTSPVLVSPNQPFLMITGDSLQKLRTAVLTLYGSPEKTAPKLPCSVPYYPARRSRRGQKGRGGAE